MLLVHQDFHVRRAAVDVDEHVLAIGLLFDPHRAVKIKVGARGQRSRPQGSSTITAAPNCEACTTVNGKS